MFPARNLNFLNETTSPHYWRYAVCGVLCAAFVIIAALIINNSKNNNVGDEFSVAMLEPRAGEETAFNLADVVGHDPDKILTLIGNDLRMLYQRPDFERRDVGAVIWQYRMASCVMDIYFYPEESNRVDDVRVAYYEIRGKDMNLVDRANDRKNCLNSLFNRGRKAARLSL